MRFSWMTGVALSAMLASGVGAQESPLRDITGRVTGPDGATLTSRAQAASAPSLVLHFRDGELKVAPGDPPPPAPAAPVRARPAPKPAPPEQGKLL